MVIEVSNEESEEKKKVLLSSLPKRNVKPRIGTIRVGNPNTSTLVYAVEGLVASRTGKETSISLMKEILKHLDKMKSVWIE